MNSILNESEIRVPAIVRAWWDHFDFINQICLANKLGFGPETLLDCGKFGEVESISENGICRIGRCILKVFRGTPKYIEIHRGIPRYTEVLEALS